MSTASDKRLDKIAAHLTPQEAFLVWLQEVNQYPTMSAYATALKDAPEASWPMYRLPQQVREAVRLAHKGASPEVLARAERQAVKDVVFLYHVHSECNTWLMADWRSLCLQALAASHLGRLFAHEIPKRDELTLTRRVALVGLTELWEWEAAVRILADRYFDGESPLFPAWAEQLSAMCAEAETLAKLYNEQLDWLAFLATKPSATMPPAGGPKTRRRRQAETVLVAAESIDLDALRVQT
jgi:hypothetical protein